MSILSNIRVSRGVPDCIPNIHLSPYSHGSFSARRSRWTSEAILLERLKFAFENTHTHTEHGYQANEICSQFSLISRDIGACASFSATGERRLTTRGVLNITGEWRAPLSKKASATH